MRRLTATTELPFRRMECEPSAEMQIDFGTGALVVAEGKRRRPHLFRDVLSHPRRIPRRFATVSMKPESHDDDHG